MGLARKRWLLFALAAALSWPGAQAREPKAPSTVQDLVYGEILFEFYQDRYLEAITRHLAATERGTLDYHAEEAELLAGGMYLAYGQHDQAETIFDRLLEQRATPEVQQRARLQLARSHYQRGNLQRSVELLDNRVFDAELRHTANGLMAGALLGLGDYARAEVVLGELRGSADAAFARYNLGVALAAQGDLDAATKQLARVSTLPVKRRRGLFRRRAATDETLPALQDQARLALGYALIRNGEPGEALQTLEGVDIDGPYASASLLGAGWAAAEMERFDLALNAWRILRQRDAADPAVQEAWFAVPYALGELAAHGQAAVAFEDSIAAIEQEDRALAAAIDHLDRHGLAGVLLAADEGAQWDAGWQLAEAPDHPLSRYLYLLMADNEFQQHLRDYRDLRALSQLLDRKRADFDSYRHMLAARKARFEEHAPLAAGFTDRSRIGQLHRQERQLQDTLVRVDADNDYLALADAGERRQLAELEAAAGKLAGLPAEKAAALSERQRVLQGLLHWRLSAEYPERRYRLQQELATVREALAEARKRQQSLVSALAGAPADNRRLAGRLDAMMPRIDATRLRIAATMHQTDRQLVRLAAAELEQRRVRLAQYLDQARYALAAIHDRAAAEGS